MLSRDESTAYLNSLDRDNLFERYAITRVGDITDLDIIGIPVYNAIRPCAQVLSVNSGKGISKELARAGAIAEAIEYATFENPVGCFHIEHFDCDPSLLPLAKDSKWTPLSPIPLEYATHYSSGEERLFPSDLLWMVHRRQKRMDFQMTSNGQAVGYCFEDAFLCGLYEAVERDALALRLYAWDQIGILPSRVHVQKNQSKIGDLVDVIAQAGLRLFLFHCTVDVPIPVYWASLVDPSLNGFFTTAGWGCDINPTRAARKAILEAIQSRCVYVAGARDDLLSQDYDQHKARDPFEQMAFMEMAPETHVLDEYGSALTLLEELELVLDRLGAWRQNIYFNRIDIDPLVAVKTVILGLEPPHNALWVPSRRCITWVQACMDTVHAREKASSGSLQQSLVTLCEMCCV